MRGACSRPVSLVGMRVGRRSIARWTNPKMTWRNHATCYLAPRVALRRLDGDRRALGLEQTCLARLGVELLDLSTGHEDDALSDVGDPVADPFELVGREQELERLRGLCRIFNHDRNQDRKSV